MSECQLLELLLMHVLLQPISFKSWLWVEYKLVSEMPKENLLLKCSSKLSTTSHSSLKLLFSCSWRLLHANGAESSNNWLSRRLESMERRRRFTILYIANIYSFIWLWFDSSGSWDCKWLILRVNSVFICNEPYHKGLDFRTFLWIWQESICGVGFNVGLWSHVLVCFLKIERNV